MAKSELSKAQIIEQAHELGAEFVGFAPVDRWREFGDVPTAFHPQQIWPQARTVIVLGVPLWLPIVEAAPTVLGREQSIVTNELLAEAGYRLALFLSRSDYRAVNIPQSSHRDRVAQQNPVAAFSHSWAGHYAGLGTIGWNHTLLTREYGPRVHLGSVFTTLELEGDCLIEENLCTKCLYCQKICPVQSFSGDKNISYAQVDQIACTQNEKRLQIAYCEPCGACIKVCPVGEDRQLFQSNNFQKYFDEQKILFENPHAEEYRDWIHMRSHGSYPLEGRTSKNSSR